MSSFTSVGPPHAPRFEVAVTVHRGNAPGIEATGEGKTKSSVSVLVAVWCSALQGVAGVCVAVCCSVLQSLILSIEATGKGKTRFSVSVRVAVWCNLLQCCVLWCFITLFARLGYVAVCCSVLQCNGGCCSVLQYVAMCCSALK